LRVWSRLGASLVLVACSSFIVMLREGGSAEVAVDSVELAVAIDS
jgi:hypothetical protein